MASVQLAHGSGSAVVFAENGYLITTAHVVGRDRQGEATFSDGDEQPSK